MIEAKNILERVMKQGVDDAICEVNRFKKSQVRFANSDIVLTNTVSKTVASIFIARKGRLIGADIDDLSSVDASIKQLVKMSNAMAPNRDYKGIAKGKFVYAKGEPTASGLHEKIVDYAHECITAAESAGAKRSEIGRAHV